MVAHALYLFNHVIETILPKKMQKVSTIHHSFLTHDGLPDVPGMANQRNPRYMSHRYQVSPLAYEKTTI